MPQRPVVLWILGREGGRHVVPLGGIVRITVNFSDVEQRNTDEWCLQERNMKKYGLMGVGMGKDGNRQMDGSAVGRKDK